MQNMAGWENVVGRDVAVAFVLVLECAESVMRERLLLRGRTSGRADDNETAISKRFQVLREETKPVVEELQRQGLVRRVQGDQTEEAVFKEVEALFLRELPPL
eukprot:Tamp_44217.p1 GENE.Tamp_44217~~Tamp_44217.p1  ORF type:complete len:103 (-),score=18.14 Tamp_44217:60-368(-)